MASKKRGLGRGLDALFADAAPVLEEENTAVIDKVFEKEEEADSGDRVHYIDIDDIKPNPNQPRKKFNVKRLEELSQSIQDNGVIQPLVVQRKGSGYELVAGERRWRASRLAGLKKVPCLIREFDEKQNLIVTIIENMQREDLDPIEEANGLRQMIHKFGFTQEQVSESLGKSRAYIANSVRLLKLPEDVQKKVSEGKISAARADLPGGIIDIADNPRAASHIGNFCFGTPWFVILQVERSVLESKIGEESLRTNSARQLEEIIIGFAWGDVDSLFNPEYVNREDGRFARAQTSFMS